MNAHFEHGALITVGFSLWKAPKIIVETGFVIGIFNINKI